MEYLTFDLSPSGKAIYMQTNALIASNKIDYYTVDVMISSIMKVILEQADNAGLNILFNDGSKETIKPYLTSRVGNIEGDTTDPETGVKIFSDSFVLRDAFRTLLSL